MDNHGVFDDMYEAIDAAYEAQKILMRDYTTMDRDRFIDQIKKEFLAIINEETIKEFNETGYGRIDEKLKKNYGSIADCKNTSCLKTEVFASSQGLTVEYSAPFVAGSLRAAVVALITQKRSPSTLFAFAASTIVPEKQQSRITTTRPLTQRSISSSTSSMAG